MSVVRQLSHHDAEDARQDAWLAAHAKGRSDDPRYVAGCERLCAIEVMRTNDRQRHLSSEWGSSNLHAVSHGLKNTRDDRGRALPVLVEHTTHLLPFDVLRTSEVLHGEDYREKLRRQERARRARRKAA